MSRTRTLGAAVAASLILAAPADAEEDTLGELSLEELMEVEVTVASRSAEEVSDTPAAVFVLSDEDIRRSGATSLPEALRWVPGLFVARGGSPYWLVGTRSITSLGGQNTSFLALMDGRILNAPFYGGVFWNVVQPPLDDLARVEVIRGPGSSTWGENAVAGVINIVSKTAEETQGVAARVLVGNQDRQAYLRYGGRAGELSYRVYGYFLERPGFFTPEGFDETADAWQHGDLGFRLDYAPSDDDTVTAIGNYYVSHEGFFTNPPSFSLTGPPTQPTRDDALYHGGNVLGRWTHDFSEETSLLAQVYYDRRLRTRDVEPTNVLTEYAVDIADAQLQLSFPPLPRNELVLGTELRIVNYDINQGTGLAYFPDQKTTLTPSLFLEDVLTVAPDVLKLRLGVRFEHNDYSGFEVQPTLRGAWTPTGRHTVWAAFTRAVRVPTRFDQDLRAYIGQMPPNTLVAVLGNPDYDSESLIAYDAGYRVRPTDSLFIDLTGYAQVASGLVTLEPGAPVPDPEHPGFVRVPLVITNGLDAVFYGGELSLRANLGPSWIQLGFSHWRSSAELRPGRMDETAVERGEGLMPQNQLLARWDVNFPHDVELDALVRFVGERPNLMIDSYVEADLRVAWNPWQDLWLSAVGQNLLADEHVEGTSEFVQTLPTAVPRAFYAQVEWRPGPKAEKSEQAQTTRPPSAP